jgi:NIMA (never in mitosis gene a)-related kinase
MKPQVPNNSNSNTMPTEKLAILTKIRDFVI